MAKSAEVVEVTEVSEEVEVIVVSIEGLKKGQAIEAGIVAGMSYDEAVQNWVDNRPERGSGFAARFYAELESGYMTDDEFDAIIKSDSVNVFKHKSHYDSIRGLVNAVRDSLTESESE